MIERNDESLEKVLKAKASLKENEGEKKSKRTWSWKRT